MKSAAAIAVGAVMEDAMARAGDEAIVRLMPGSDAVELPRDFTGLGYEMLSVARPGLLSVSNAAYVRLVRQLGPGVIRVGGIVADFTRYEAHGRANDGPKDTVITRSSLREFRGFLDAVGWRAIWSVNFAYGSLDDAVEETKAVKAELGDRLLALELGNEVENYGRGREPVRAGGYSYEAYREEYRRWHAALVAAVPGLRFAAPDTAASLEWVERMAADAAGDVQLLTTHYYRGDQKLGTEAQLLTPDVELKGRLERLRKASQASGIPWRMCETNSFYGGGRPGVSDTLAGALWTLDFMLLLASYGCGGVNIETGTNQLGFVSSYSPIQDDGKGRNWAGAPYYGMLAFATAARGATKVCRLQAGDGLSGLTAYGLEMAAKRSVTVLVNRDGERGATVSLTELGPKSGRAMRLRGRSLHRGEGVTFGGAVAGAEGGWTADRGEPVDAGRVPVPAGSAAVVSWD